MHADVFLMETAEIAQKIDRESVERMARELQTVRDIRGRVFVVGVGGSYANAEHVACDLRKLCDIEAYAPNTAEMSAWMNDAGPDEAFTGHLRTLEITDLLLVLSVGGGASTVSKSLMKAVDRAREVGARVCGIVGPNGGYTYEHADTAVRVPAPAGRVTPHAEAFQAVIWHLLVSHPLLQRNATKW